jgi:isoleucyl-tRNA synthetase
VPPYRPVDPQQSFPDLELTVLERWRERDVFKESLRNREGAEQWVFYEGPPTANGRPGSHHVLARVFKDLYPRYKTMQGYRVERKGGWDCHGLPVEIAVEQKLGITEKDQIEAYGIAKFNEECRRSVFEFLEDWNRLTERIGFWVDLEHAYRTLDNGYIESVWWALAQIHEKGLLYEGHKVVPYCPRCGTALSSHEVALGYRDVTDPSVYVKLRLEDEPGTSLLVWTTTPWTLPGNVAVAVNPDVEYARVQHEGETLILAAARVQHVLGEGASATDTFPGSQLAGRRYAGPVFPAADREPGGLPVIGAQFVTTDDGTGLVHLAPAFGQDDFDAVNAAAGARQEVYNPVGPDGTYDERVSGYAGRFVKDPALTRELIADLDGRGLLLRAEPFEHSYPHCWRCGTPLIYYAKRSWYIATSTLREELLAANETVAWHPEHIKHGRFGDWLQNNVDWALSRERYWGTPLPVWRCAQDHRVVVGSFAELERRSGTAISDPHRPYVDEIAFPCEECGGEMRRVPEVIDVWFDSGAMPFAQHHAPFENEAQFAAQFPADFICEALDQTRGWFYSLLAVSTLVHGRSPYRNVVCLGLILDGEGQKMSKSRGNIVEPQDVIDRFGADAFRWYFFTAKAPWDGYRFSTEAVGEGVRLFLRQLWNTYSFYVLYANAGDAARDADGPRTDLDRWVLSRLSETTAEVTERLDAYDATTAGRAIAQFVDDLSNWYVRRSRRRFWDAEPGAFATLRECLVTVSRLLAPFTPFVADEIHDNLGAGASVHLADFPRAGERDAELEFAMGTARETVRLGLAARTQAKIKLRQPLREAVIVAGPRERAAIERLEDIVRDELNVKRLRFVAAADELGRYELKPNYRTLGPRAGKHMKQLVAAIAALDPTQVAAALERGEQVGVSVDGHEYELGPEDLLLALAPLEGYSLQREGSHAVALELALDEELLREGLAREIVRAAQEERKNAGLAVEDRIALALGGDGTLLDAARAHGDHIAGETLATSLAFDATSGTEVEIEGRRLVISLVRSS